MALNVYLTIFHNYGTERLKSLEWRYHLLCYGYPFVVAVIYLFISTPSRGRIYGPATLWCWIDIRWVFLRIATCYVEAWVCIIVSFCIYVFAGLEIFKKRQHLRQFKTPHGQIVPIENPFTDFKTTQISITNEPAHFLPPGSDTVERHLSTQQNKAMPRSPTPTAVAGLNAYEVIINTAASSPLEPKISHLPLSTPRVLQQRNNRAALEANTAAWGYTKVAILFFVSLLVTWVRIGFCVWARHIPSVLMSALGTVICKSSLLLDSP